MVTVDGRQPGYSVGMSLEELAVTGLTVDEIRARSFKKILEGRTRAAGGGAS